MASAADLVRFLLARLDDDVAEIKRLGRGVRAGGHTGAQLQSGLCVPERLRAECEAKRQVIGILQQQLVLRDQPFEKAIRHQAVTMLRTLAMPYAGHVAYRKGWALSAPL